MSLELAIGARGIYDGVEFEVVEGDGCVGCLFTGVGCIEEIWTCSSEMRNDGTAVIFKQISQPKDTITINGETYKLVKEKR